MQPVEKIFLRKAYFWRTSLRGYWSLFLRHYKCSKVTQGDNKVYYRSNPNKIVFEIFMFFRFFSKWTNKNYVYFYLTTETLRYHLDCSKFSDQCFNGFLWSLLSKKSKHFFFEIFSWVLKKNIFRVLGWNLKKCSSLSFVFVSACFEKNLNEFCNFS